MAKKERLRSISNFSVKKMTLFIQKVTTKVTLQMEIFKLGMDSRLVFGLIYQIYFIKNPANLRSQLPSTV